jgi:signal transduction histidine kinase/DNA-binding response OmpR family regulator
MVELLLSPDPGNRSTSDLLLEEDEIIVIVDDSPEETALLQTYLKNQNLNSVSASSKSELLHNLNNRSVAIVLLDMSLPDRNGYEVIAELTRYYPDMGIIMVTGNTDLQVALDCLRQGADDYLTKPVNIVQFYNTVSQTLKKRKLAIENRLFQQELELTTLRTQFLHHLNLKMNNAYLNVMELENVLQTILIGITSEEGLKFNRAVLALFDDGAAMLRGVLAIGPGSREDAVEVWNEIKRKNLKLQDHFSSITSDFSENDVIVNEIVRSLAVPASNSQHPQIYACRNRTPLLVSHGESVVDIPAELIETLGEDTFVIAPLYSPSQALGVIIADNFVTRQPIEKTDIEALEIFAGQASIAIAHSRLYMDMQTKIDELEIVTHELEKSKNLLLEAERYSALGQMSAQLVHALRNPITSIGGTARLLSKRNSNPKNQKFLKVLSKESAKLEATLSDLFNFVNPGKMQKSIQPLFPLIRRSVMIFYGTMKKSNITYEIDLEGEDPIIAIDSEKIRQVFLHLIRNCLEAMPDGGTLLVKGEKRQDQILVTISDTGSGIVENDLSRVTDPFYTTKTYGTGMGLTLVKQILDQHNAIFSLTPNESQGTTATITFQR